MDGPDHPDFDAAVERLKRLPELEFEVICQDEAKQLRVTPAALRRVVAKARGQDQAAGERADREARQRKAVEAKAAREQADRDEKSAKADRVAAEKATRADRLKQDQEDKAAQKRTTDEARAERERAKREAKEHKNVLKRAALVAREAAAKMRQAAAADLDGFALNEDGIAQAFVAKYKDLLRYDHSRGQWFHWTGTVWRQENTNLAFEWARVVCRNLAMEHGADSRAKTALARATTAGGVERFAKNDRAVVAKADTWDQDPFLLGTPTGVIDLRTCELRPAKPTDYITKLTSIGPSEMPDCPVWLRFLDEATGSDAGMIRFLRQWSGYTLTGDTREHALVFIYGPGGNGKSLFLNVISWVLGDYAATAAMDVFTSNRTSQHLTFLAMLAGARMVSSSETEEGRAWAEVKIKQLTGGDPITANFMRKDPFTFQPQFKLMIAGNNAPVLHTVDEAHKRRINVVPFTFKPETPDRELETKLRAEGPGILRWMAEGALDWLKNGLVRPDVIKNATEAYFSDQDVIQQWIDDCCEVGENFMDTTARLHSNLRKYTEERGEAPVGSKAFKTAMDRRGFGAIKDVSYIRGRGRSGIKVKFSQSAKDAAPAE